MRVFILGAGNDDKGTQLERLTTKILEYQGYSNINTNVELSGANEIDVMAERKDITGVKTITTPVICECKAHNRSISLEDWLKFIGKLSIERKKNASTIGLMISLSGAKGTVIGSYKNDFGDDNERVQLIVNDDLCALVEKIFNITNIRDLKNNFSTYYGQDCLDIDYVYYDYKLYLLVSLGNNRFTLCDTNGNLLKENDVKNILPLFDMQTDYDSESFVDIPELSSYKDELHYIENCIITSLFCNTSKKLIDIQKHLIYAENKNPIPKETLLASIEQSPYLCYNSTEDIVTIEIGEDFIGFLKYLFEVGMPLDLFANEKFQANLNAQFIGTIKKIQFNLQLSNEEDADILFFLKHSPSALAYAITPDTFLHSYEFISGRDASLKKTLEYEFKKKILRAFEKDFSNPQYHSLYLQLGISSVQSNSSIGITKNGSTHAIDFKQILDLIPINSQNNAIIISKKIE